MTSHFAIALDFWGVRLRVISRHRADLEHFGYYFGSYAPSAPREPDIELLLEADDPPAGPSGGPSGGPDGGFVRALTDPLRTKRLLHRLRGGDWREWEVFTAASRRPTPLPPFALPGLRERVLPFHAAFLQSPAGVGVAAAGASFSGKSMLALELARRGWRCLSDDILVYDHGAGMVLPFLRPVGIRENTRRHLRWIEPLLAERAEGARRIGLATGDTVMIRIEQLLGGVASDRPAAPHCWLALRNVPGATFRAEEVGLPAARDLIAAAAYDVTDPPLAAAAIDRAAGTVAVRRVTFDLENGFEELAAYAESLGGDRG